MVLCRKGVSFNPETDIPSLEGKVILITGASEGLGKQSALEFARHNPRQIWLVARNLEKLRTVEFDIKSKVPGANLRVLHMELTSFASIRTACATFSAECDRLDILMLNAGIMAAGPGLTEDGYELQFGTNHMSHALLTKLLMPVLERTEKAGNAVRIVSLSSNGHSFLSKGKFNFDSLRTEAESMGAYTRYFQSKLANVLWARAFAKHYPQFTISAIHPGVVKTGLMNGSTQTPQIVRAIFLKFGGFGFLNSVEEGVKNQLWAATVGEVENGEYYEPVGLGGTTSDDGKNDELAEKLWKWTEEELEVRGGGK